MLNGRKIVLGVCGGIAAYKAAALCSRLVQAGAEVRVIMTASARQFVTPLTFQTLSRSHVHTDAFEERDPSVVAHIDLADWPDLVVVAPATANMLAKMALGLADDLLSTVLLATTAPVMAAPAMNVHMYEHPAVQANMAALAQRGVRFIEPGVGQLACGYVGKGRLAEPEDILEEIVRFFAGGSRGLLDGRRVLVTAGGTIERIDPVRYISNDSSGKMGYALADAARRAGADVVLISANAKLDPPGGVEVVRVESAREVREAVMARLDGADVVIKAAAVADYRPVTTHAQKMKKVADRLTLELEKTPDILREIGERKTRQFVVGFAAETEDVERNAMDKLRRKNCDLLVANDVSRPGIGFGSDYNSVQVFAPEGLIATYPPMEKSRIAEELIRIIAGRLPAGGGN